MTIYRILWRNALVYLLLFVVLLVAGTIGYMLLQHFTFIEALYMTTITLASVGFSETRPLDNTGRVFTICLILANLGILTYVVTKISRFLFDGEFIKLYKQLSMENKIATHRRRPRITHKRAHRRPRLSLTHRDLRRGGDAHDRRAYPERGRGDPGSDAPRHRRRDAMRHHPPASCRGPDYPDNRAPGGAAQD